MPVKSNESHNRDFRTDNHAIENELKTLVCKNKRELNDQKCIPLLWAFAVKFDGRHRARCVAGGHVTPDLEEAPLLRCSGV